MGSEKDKMEQQSMSDALFINDNIEVDTEQKKDISTETISEENVSEESIFGEIIEKLKEIESSDEYAILQKSIARNESLILESQSRVAEVKTNISLYNKYIKELADNFLKVLLNTGWFDKYYDAVCLFDRAHTSQEASEWCEAVKETVEESIANRDAKKIRALLNNRIINTVFTLSTRTPYLRLIEGEFTDITPFVTIQSRSFYGWLKNIETLSLVLRNLWLELEYPSIITNTYSNNSKLYLCLEESNDTLITRVQKYVEEETHACCSDRLSCLAKIKDDIESFMKVIQDAIEYYNNIYEQNEEKIKYLTDKLLNDYYKKDLELIYGIYDGIQLSIDSLKRLDESEERGKWYELLKKLSEVILSFLFKQNINLLPELSIDESHVEGKYEINNQEVKFFDFAKITVGIKAPNDELIGCVASICSYGFYRIDSKKNIKIIRETKVAVYSKEV